jgi:histidinol-phosphate phosphatase family protein
VVIVLDRDGTIVVDRGYLGDPEGLEFMPTAQIALRHWRDQRCRLIVTTNQSGVGRGIISAAQVTSVNDRLIQMVDSAGGRIEEIFVCPHSPDEHCACRKPALGLIEQAARRCDFDPRRAVFIGDKETDVEFGRRAGGRSIHLSSSSTNSNGALTAATLLEAAYLSLRLPEQG